MLASPLTLTLVRPITVSGGRGVISYQLVMMPEADMAIGYTRIPANSVVDVNNLVAWPANAVRNLPLIGEDLQAVSQGPIYLYFASTVTLVAAGARRVAPLAQQPPLPSGTIITSTLAVLPSLPPRFISIHIGEVLSLSLDSTATNTAEGNATGTEESILLTAADFVLPAGSFMVIGEGSELDYLSYNRASKPIITNGSYY